MSIGLQALQENTKKTIKRSSFSKVNLGLWVKEKRADNYHDIETIFFENKNLYDDIKIELVENNTLIINVLFLQEDLNYLIPKSKNSIYLAACLFFKKVQKSYICNIEVNKNIPIEAGLGGGSSNAACVLKGLNELFKSPLTNNELLDLALEIGSDVPFFILGETCLATGRGEILTSLENKLNLDICIVKSKEISISTKWAYEQIDAREFQVDRKEQISNLILAMKGENYELFFENMFNDFEIVAFSCFPELILERKKLLDKGYKVVGLCGSGSALFGVKSK